MQQLCAEAAQQVAEMDEQLVQLRGTIGEMQAKAAESVNARLAAEDSHITKDDSDEAMPGLAQVTGVSLNPSAPVGEYIRTLQSMVDAATKWRQAEVDAYVGTHQASTQDADLRLARAELVANYEAARQLLKSMFKIDVDELPAPPAEASGSKRSSGGTGGAKNLRFYYYKKDGSKNYKKNNANRLSTVAYQQFGQAKEAELKAALGNPNFFQNWEGETTLNGITVRWGWEVVSGDSPADSDNKDDETDEALEA